MSSDDGIYYGYWKVGNRRIWAFACVGAIDNLSYFEEQANRAGSWDTYEKYVSDIWGRGPFYTSEMAVREAAIQEDKKINTEYGVSSIGKFEGRVPHTVLNSEEVKIKIDFTQLSDEEIDEIKKTYGLQDWSNSSRGDGSLDPYRLANKSNTTIPTNDCIKEESTLGHDEMSRILECFAPDGWRVNAFLDTNHTGLQDTLLVATPCLVVKLWWGEYQESSTQNQDDL